MTPEPTDRQQLHQALDALLDTLLAQRVQAPALSPFERGLTDAELLGLPRQSAYTLYQLEDHLPLSYDSLYKLYHQGVLKGRNDGGKIIVFRWSVLEFLGLKVQSALEHVA